MAASTPTVSVPATAPVTLRIVASIVNRSAFTMTFNSADIAKSAPARVSCLRSIASFTLEMGAKSSAARASIRLALMLPNSPASSSNAFKARAELRNIASTLDTIASMFVEVPSLMGQEIGKNADGDSVCGRHVANSLFGTESVSASRKLLKGIV
jgi:hypothetical protein